MDGNNVLTTVNNIAGAEVKKDSQTLLRSDSHDNDHSCQGYFNYKSVKRKFKQLSIEDSCLTPDMPLTDAPSAKSTRLSQDSGASGIFSRAKHQAIQDVLPIFSGSKCPERELDVYSKNFFSVKQAIPEEVGRSLRILGLEPMRNLQDFKNFFVKLESGVNIYQGTVFKYYLTGILGMEPSIKPEEAINIIKVLRSKMHSAVIPGEYTTTNLKCNQISVKK